MAITQTKVHIVLKSVIHCRVSWIWFHLSSLSWVFLYETRIDVASVHEQPKYVSFAHKMLHEFSASQFIANALKETRNITVSMQSVKLIQIGLPINYTDNYEYL